MTIKRLLGISLSAAFVVTGCGGGSDRSSPDVAPPDDDPVAVEATPETDTNPVDLGVLLSGAARYAGDSDRDAGRKPVEVLNYLGIGPGDAVIDLMAASGWYTEVLSFAVGTEGSVVAQNPEWILAFRERANDNALSVRLADNRLPNVTRLDAEYEDMSPETGQFDAAISALNFHDAYYLGSPEAAAGFLSVVYSMLKPGGVFGMIDHSGNPDGPDTDNSSLHRIDKAIALQMAQDAGFVVEGESDVLANAADDHSQGVFSEGLRGNTDRFVLKLRKPAE